MDTQIKSDDNLGEHNDTEIEQQDSASEPESEGSTESNDSVTVDDLVKQESRSEAAKKIAESEAKKFLVGEKSEDQIPQWVRADAMRIAREISGNKTSEDKVLELERKFQERLDRLEAEKLEERKAADDKKAKTIISDFLNGYDMNPKEFDSEYGKEYFAEVKRLMSMGHTKSDATKYALADIKFSLDSAEREFNSQSAGMSIPTSGYRTEKGSKSKLTARQIELAKKFGNDPDKVYS